MSLVTRIRDQWRHWRQYEELLDMMMKSQPDAPPVSAPEIVHE